MFEHLRRLAMNLQPGQRFAERSAVHQRFACARREVHVDEAALKAQNLAQSFDVAARERK